VVPHSPSPGNRYRHETVQNCSQHCNCQDSLTDSGPPEAFFTGAGCWIEPLCRERFRDPSWRSTPIVRKVMGRGSDPTTGTESVQKGLGGAFLSGVPSV